MAKPLGSEKIGGRQKGSQNKITKQLKDMILGALDDVGGQAYLAQQAIDEPVAFLGLIGKVLPTTLNATVEEKRDYHFTIFEVGSNVDTDNSN